MTILHLSAKTHPVHLNVIANRASQAMEVMAPVQVSQRFSYINPIGQRYTTPFLMVIVVIAYIQAYRIDFVGGIGG